MRVGSKAVLDEEALKRQIRDHEQRQKKQDTSMARVREKFGDNAAGLFELSLKSALGTPGITSPYTYSGWMEKVASSGTHWDRRWFCLEAGSYMLQYFKSADAQREGSQSLGSLDVRDCWVSFAEHKGAIKHFSLYTRGRKLKLRATKQHDYTYWKDALERFVGDGQKPETPGREASPVGTRSEASPVGKRPEASPVGKRPEASPVGKRPEASPVGKRSRSELSRCGGPWGSGRDLTESDLENSEFEEVDIE